MKKLSIIILIPVRKFRSNFSYFQSCLRPGAAVRCWCEQQQHKWSYGVQLTAEPRSAPTGSNTFPSIYTALPFGDLDPELDITMLMLSS